MVTDTECEAYDKFSSQTLEIPYKPLVIIRRINIYFRDYTITIISTVHMFTSVFTVDTIDLKKYSIQLISYYPKPGFIYEVELVFAPLLLIWWHNHMIVFQTMNRLIIYYYAKLFLRNEAI